MQYAGDMIDRFEIAAYNCSFLNVSDIKAFSEILYLTMCGVGVGFGIEREVVEKLPIVKKLRNTNPLFFTVEDSTQG